MLVNSLNDKIERKHTVFPFFLSLIVHSLKCYNCDSPTSFEDCDQNRREIFCPQAFEQCLKVNVEYNHQYRKIKSFSKSCHRSEQCSRETLPACKDAAKVDPKSKCQFSCCTGDRCNAISKLVASSVVTLQCVLLTVAGFLWS